MMQSLCVCIITKWEVIIKEESHVVHNEYAHNGVVDDSVKNKNSNTAVLYLFLVANWKDYEGSSLLKK